MDNYKEKKQDIYNKQNLLALHPMHLFLPTSANRENINAGPPMRLFKNNDLLRLFLSWASGFPVL